MLTYFYEIGSKSYLHSPIHLKDPDQRPKIHMKPYFRQR